MTNTGCTFSEIIGLHYDDIFLSEYKNYIIIRSNQHRKIKGNHKKRIIPLVGISIWGARNIKNLGEPKHLAFENYSFTSKKKHQLLTHINKQLKLSVSNTSQSLSYTLLERLKKVNCPEFVILEILGRTKEKILYNYECSFEMKNAWLKQIEV